MVIIELTPADRISFCEAISALRPCVLAEEEFLAIYEERQKLGIKTFVAVGEKVFTDQVLGTASFFFETKFIHNGGKVAHIEDVAVRSGLHGHGVGRALMEHCETVARSNGCYKIVLDCDSSNIGFYERLGYVQHETQMRKDLGKSSRDEF